MTQPTGSKVEIELVDKLDEAADRLLFLSEVSRVLSAALTDRDCFNRLLSLLIPKIGDWGTLNVVDELGRVQRVAVCAADPSHRRILEERLSESPPTLQDPFGPGNVIAGGQAEFKPNSKLATRERLDMIGHAEWLGPITDLGIISRITVPLKAHGKVLGALLIATSESGRLLTQDDFKLTEEIATRAAFTTFTLMRYSRASLDIQRLRIEMEDREHYLSQLRHDVLSVLSGASLSAQLIQRTEDAERKNKYALRVVAAIDRATEIIRKAKQENARRTEDQAS